MEAERINELLAELERGLTTSLDRHRLQTEAEILRARLAVLEAAGGAK